MISLARATSRVVSTNFLFSARRYNTLVIGSVALDTHCQLDASTIKYHDSNPAKILSSLGGVAYNVAASSRKQGNSDLKLISAVGDDYYGRSISNMIEFPHDLNVLKGKKTSQYISIQDSQGHGLVLGLADMDIIEELDLSFIEDQIKREAPKVVLIDANISGSLICHIAQWSQRYEFKVFFEPTSFKKASRFKAVSNLPSSASKPQIFLCTPTINELESMSTGIIPNEVDDFIESASNAITNDLKRRLETNQDSYTDRLFYKELLQRRTFWHCIRLLPFVKNILLKDGANGVILITQASDSKELLETKNVGFRTLYSSPESTLKIRLEHYKVANTIERPKSVNGAGDAFAGSILKDLALLDGVLETEERYHVIMRAHNASYARLLENLKE